MALFKILKGTAANLPDKKTEGFCYVTTDTNRFYIDLSSGNDGKRIELTVAVADKLTTGTTGASTKPVYFSDGKPVAINYTIEKSVPSDAVFTDTTYSNATTSTAGLMSPTDKIKLNSIDLSGYLPLSAGENKKLTGPLGLTHNINYGSTLPEEPFDGQLFFLEGDNESLPLGGLTGQVLTKNSNANGDVSWKEIVALPKGGSVGQSLIKNSSSDGDASWQDIVALPIGGSSGQYLVKNSSIDGDASWQNLPSLNYLPLTGGTIAGNLTVTGNITGSKVYGAVWNDYAEYRNTIEPNKPGYCVVEVGDDSLRLSSKRLEKGAMIVSDTFGFAIGETEQCKTPIAVSGRVLAYTNEPREEYKKHIGDCVCAGPNGKICIMTDEEAKNYPSAILGTISAIPEYEIWGSDNIIVDNRVWIKIR